MNFKFKLSRRLAGFLPAAGLVLAAAACGDTRLSEPGSTDPLAINASRIASLTLTPAVDTLAVGATVQFTAAATDTRGNVLGARNVQWSSSDTAVATVASGGLATARAPGRVQIVASAHGYVDTAVVIVLAPTAPPDTTVVPPPPDTTVVQPPPDTTTTVPADPVHAGYYVAATGSATGDGSVARPWDLATALNGSSGRIAAGDTVWLRGGTYAGFFVSSASGAVGTPIVFRQYPGERATIDGYLRANGHDVAFWGFEIMRSAPSGTLPGLESRGARQKFINLVIHDAAQQGITFWDEAIDAEVYGCIVYNNGTHENLDHGIYVHNTSGTKLIRDNVFFDNLAYGIHVYAGPTALTQRNVHVIGNVSFNNGTISTQYAAKGNIIIGAEVPDVGMQAIDNLLYFSGSAGENLRLGYLASNQDVTVTGNMVVGGYVGLVVGDWASATVQGNTISGPNRLVDFRDAPSGYLWGTNRHYRSASATAWLYQSSALTLSGWQSATGLGATDLLAGSAPTVTQVFVRPNVYERGRALVVVYNFGAQGAVTVDLAGVLAIGQRFEVRNVQDLFGTPVAGGTFGGGAVTLPMTGVAAPAPIGRATPTPPRTGPAFDTFVVVPL